MDKNKAPWDHEPIIFDVDETVDPNEPSWGSRKSGTDLLMEMAAEKETNG